MTEKVNIQEWDSSKAERIQLVLSCNTTVVSVWLFHASLFHILFQRYGLMSAIITCFLSCLWSPGRKRRKKSKVMPGGSWTLLLLTFYLRELRYMVTRSCKRVWQTWFSCGYGQEIRKHFDGHLGVLHIACLKIWLSKIQRENQESP